MGKEIVNVKGHYRKLPDGSKTHVSAHQRKITTTKSYDEWFTPKGHTGWSKEQSKDYRRRKVLDSTDKRKTWHNRYVEAGRKMQYLTNVTQDKETERKAKKDADYFFDMAKKHTDD